MRTRSAAALAAAAAVLVLTGTADAASVPGFTELVSVSSEGVQANASSFLPAVSADGHYVAFVTNADNLVRHDTNNAFDIFVRDRLRGTLERVSVSSTGHEGDGDSGLLNLMGGPSLSADGRFVAFSSEATNLVKKDTNGFADVFVRDRLTGTTEIVSVASDGTPARGGSVDPAISGDGRFVAFVSTADNIVVPDTNGFGEDLYVHDRVAGTTVRVSDRLDGSQPTSGQFQPVLSGDGRFVVWTTFESYVPFDDGFDADVMLRDLQTGVLEQISAVPAGSSGITRNSDSPAISSDGRFVAFNTLETNIVRPDKNDTAADVIVLDRQTGIYERVSVDEKGAQVSDPSFSPSISDDGRFVAFVATGALVAEDTNSSLDIYVGDRQAGRTLRASVSTSGAQADNRSDAPAISGDGLAIAFTSLASNFVPVTQADHVFVRDAH